jgi:flavin-dependent dehydrogenase
LELGPNEYPHDLTSFNKLHFHVYGMRVGLKTRQYAIRRSEFDAWLIERAEVPIHQHEVHTITRDGGYYVIDDAYRCRHLVGAGGTYCPAYKTFFSNTLSRGALIATIEVEFPYDYQDARCHLWFFENKLPGYSWYVPKRGGHVNIGIGGVASSMKSRGVTIREHWSVFVEKLRAEKFIDDRPFDLQGYTYHLRQKRSAVQLDGCYLVGDAAGLATKDLGEGIAPAIRSGLGAARAIIEGTNYSLESISAWSLPGIFKARWA